MPITRRGATGPLLVPLPGRMHVVAASDVAVIAALCLWALILRLPFFFPDTIDWDESTLIIMGRGIRDGLLPYDRIWDSKPPLAYAAYAGAIELLGRSVAALRVAGYLGVVLTSYLVYRASELIAQDKLSAFVAALVATAMMSVLAPALMTELLCVPLLSAALLLLCSGHGSPRRAFLAGLLIGMAAMIRSNLAVLGFAVGLLVIARPPLVPPARPVTRGFAYAAGVLLIVAITVIPYLVSGRLPLWFDTVIRAGAEFSAHHRSFDNLRSLVQIAFGIRSDGTTRPAVLLLGVPLWIGGLAGLLCCAGRWRELTERQRDAIIATAVFLTGATLAVAMTGPPYGHYLVQIVPWFAIALGFALASVRIATARWLLVAGMGVALIAAAVVHTRASYEALLTRIELGQSLAYGPAYEIADYVRSAGQGPSSLYMMSDHLVYWLTGTYPPTRMSTHPSVLTKPEIIAAVEGADATPDTELRKILATRPEFIVKPPVVDYLSGWPELVRMLDETLARDYVLATSIAGRQVYRRKPDAR